jgi:hypothetical protein
MIVPVDLAEVVADPATFPAGTRASRCRACGETRLHYPGDRTDEWKHHFDYCGEGDESRADPDAAANDQ